MKLGTRLTLSLSLIIILILSGYGYFHISSRREVFTRMMKIEARSISEILGISLQKISLPRETVRVQELLDAVSGPERTLGVLFFHRAEDRVFRSNSLQGDIGHFLEWIHRSIREDRPREEYGFYEKNPVFSHTFPLKNPRGRIIGGVTLLQHTSFLEENIQEAKQSIFFVVLILIAVMVAFILFITRRWLTIPIVHLMEGIQKMAKGQLSTRIDFRRGDEISELARAFNQMASDLQEAQQKIIREAESKLELERNLRQSEKLATIGQLASELAHEIGTPLNIIGGRVELSQKRLEDKETLKKNLDIIAGQTGKITRTIQQLLGFVRKKRPEKTPLSIHSLLENILDFLDQKIEKQKVRVEKNFMTDFPFVEGDSDQLQQVFLNLILNALQAMPAGGTLRLSTLSREIAREGPQSCERTYLEVGVEDTGFGMDREVIKNIFSPFFTTKVDERGTGLGLTITEGIVREHDGWIEVESAIGKGSIFKVGLPTVEYSVRERSEGFISKPGGENQDERENSDH